MKLRDYSPLTWFFEQAFRGLEWLPPSVIATMVHKRRAVISTVDLHDPVKTALRAKSVERFLLVWFGLDVLAFAATFAATGILLALSVVWAILRIIGVLQAAVNIALFDRLRGRTDNRVVSLPRLVVIAFLNFGELLLCFATIYGANLLRLANAHGSWDALYFSVTTQLTIGYGDLVPTGFLRAVIAIQALSGLAFVVLIFARMVAALPKIEEIITPDQ